MDWVPAWYSGWSCPVPRCVKPSAHQKTELNWTEILSSVPIFCLLTFQIWFLCLYKARSIVFSNWPFVCQFVSYMTFEHDILIENERTDFDESWYKWSSGQWHEMLNFGVRRSKVKSCKAKDSFGDKSDASFWTSVGWLAFLVVLVDHCFFYFFSAFIWTDRETYVLCVLGGGCHWAIMVDVDVCRNSCEMKFTVRSSNKWLETKTGEWWLTEIGQILQFIWYVIQTSMTQYL